MINKTINNNKLNTGFTLIELMIVVAILGILLSLAFVNYTGPIQESRRTEAKTALLDYAMRFEEFYGSNSTYTGADTYFSLNTTPKTENNYYQLTASITNAGANYTLTATAINVQAKDTVCKTMTIDQLGQKLPVTCWN